MGTKLILTSSPAAVVIFLEAPRWYFTSPENTSSSNSFPSNSEKICLYDFWKILVKTFSLPLCAIPRITSSTPCTDDLEINWSNAGIRDSPPSKEKRF